MNWYKHDTDASSDAKVKKLLIRHGAVGYAIYFHCLELIAGDIDENNITFELEHDAEIIADNLKIKGDANQSGVDVVNTIMRYIVELGLFENHDGRITCFKLLKRLDTSMTGSSQLRSLIAKAKENHDAVMIGHDAVMTPSCKTRLDKTRLEEKKSIVRQKPDVTPIAESTREVVAYLNSRADTRFSTEAQGHRKCVAGLLKKGYTVEDMKKVIAVKCLKWKDDEKMYQYLRPSTLFRPSHFDDYLGEYETEKAHAED